MHQFLHGKDLDFDELERRATGACVAYRDQELPPGSSPRRTRIGFEVIPSDGSVLLLVDYGVTYAGSSSEVRAWLQRGERRFRNFSDLKSWIRGELALCYDVVVASRSGDQCQQPQVAVSPTELTDLDVIRNDLADIGRPVIIDDNDRPSVPRTDGV